MSTYTNESAEVKHRPLDAPGVPGERLEGYARELRESTRDDVEAATARDLDALTPSFHEGSCRGAR